MTCTPSDLFSGFYIDPRFWVLDTYNVYTVFFESSVLIHRTLPPSIVPNRLTQNLHPGTPMVFRFPLNCRFSFITLLTSFYDVTIVTSTTFPGPRFLTFVTSRSSTFSVRLPNRMSEIFLMSGCLWNQSQVTLTKVWKLKDFILSFTHDKIRWRTLLNNVVVYLCLYNLYHNQL